MATGSNDDWSETSPTAAEVVSAGAAEIRYLRGSVRQRLLKEHVEPDAVNVGGEHLAGSAVSYIGDYSEAFPLVRPDGVTTLTTEDLGRLAYDTDSAFFYILTNHVGPVWTQVSANPMTPATYEGEESITFPNGLVIKHGTKTSTEVIDTVEFAAAFDTACVSVQITQLNTNPLNYNLRAYSYTVGGFLWNSAVKGYKCSWLAIGY